MSKTAHKLMTAVSEYTDEIRERTTIKATSKAQYIKYVNMFAPNIVEYYKHPEQFLAAIDHLEASNKRQYLFHFEKVLEQADLVVPDIIAEAHQRTSAKAKKEANAHQASGKGMPTSAQILKLSHNMATDNKIAALVLVYLQSGFRPGNLVGARLNNLASPITLEKALATYKTGNHFVLWPTSTGEDSFGGVVIVNHHKRDAQYGTLSHVLQPEAAKRMTTAFVNDYYTYGHAGNATKRQQPPNIDTARSRANRDLKAMFDNSAMTLQHLRRLNVSSSLSAELVEHLRTLIRESSAVRAAAATGVNEIDEKDVSPKFRDEFKAAKAAAAARGHSLEIAIHHYLINSDSTDEDEEEESKNTRKGKEKAT